LRLDGLDRRTNVNVSQVGADLGTAIPKWISMGSPAYPSQEQIGQLRTAAELPPPKRQILPAEKLAEFSITLPPDSVALLEFEK
jgi:beta-xylosidase